MSTAIPITVIAAALWVALVAPAQAAVRICLAPVSSGLASDLVESRARAKALLAWAAKARAAGSLAPSWRIAAQKQLRCAKVASGNFDCVAFAQPCTISQVPRPSPLPPPPRGKVKDKPIAT